MVSHEISLIMASVVAGATPVVIATLGETISEKSGIINLSLDGTILLSAMTAFVVSYSTGSVFLGFASAAMVGGFVAAVVAFFSINLGQSQVAVGFVLTLMTRDLAYFLGNRFTRIPGPQVSPMPIPWLKEIPIIGQAVFHHNILVYFSIILIPVFWFYIEKTGPGLALKAAGENPEAAYARGISPQKIQFFYTIVGGLFVGIAGAAFSLFTKPGWGRPQGAEGTGWIVLALVIFGGWNPVRAAAGAYLFAFLQVMAIYFQEWFPSVPAQVFQVAPFPLMIFTLVFFHLSQQESVRQWAEKKPLADRLLKQLSGSAPTALGKPFRPDK